MAEELLEGFRKQRAAASKVFLVRAGWIRTSEREGERQADQMQEEMVMDLAYQMQMYRKERAAWWTSTSEESLDKEENRSRPQIYLSMGTEEKGEGNTKGRRAILLA